MDLYGTIVYLCFGGEALVDKEVYSKEVYFLATTVSVSSCHILAPIVRSSRDTAGGLSLFYLVT